MKRGRLSQPTAFHLQSREVKIRTMLGWFVSCDVATKASRLGSEAIDVAEVERDSERVPVKCTEVDLSVIRAYFSCDAWQAVLHLVEVVKRVLRASAHWIPVQVLVVTLVWNGHT